VAAETYPKEKARHESAGLVCAFLTTCGLEKLASKFDRLCKSLTSKHKR
jgi:hypothetical protein